jgi:hypothetical protein
MRRFLTSAVVMGAVVPLLPLTACGDEPTVPQASVAVVPPGAPSALSPTADHGDGLREALLFAREQSLRALMQSPAAADRVAQAFATLAGRVQEHHAVATDRALAAARRAVQRYRATTASDQSRAAPDLAALELTLDLAASLIHPAREAPDTRAPTSADLEDQP